MKKYAVRLFSYQLKCDSVKAICSTRENAYEIMKKLFDILLRWLPEEATEINYSISDEGWRRDVSFNPKSDTTVECLRGRKRVHVEIYCVEFEEDELPSESVRKDCFFEEG